MYKIKIINFITLLVVFCSCENNPTEGFKVEGKIKNFQDCSSINKVMVIVPDDYNFEAKISESKFENNYFSMFLPYELKDKYCSAVGINKYGLFESEFGSYLTISTKNVKISNVLFNSNNKNYAGGNITQFGYIEDFNDNNGVVTVTLVKTKYFYTQSAVSITGDYVTRLKQVEGEDFYKTIKMDLFLQKGWNIIYHIGNFTSKPYSSYGLYDMDTAIINITTEKPENIELKWYYRFREYGFDILWDDWDNTMYINSAWMWSYRDDFIIGY